MVLRFVKRYVFILTVTENYPYFPKKPSFSDRFLNPTVRDSLHNQKTAEELYNTMHILKKMYFISLDICPADMSMGCC